MDETKPLTHIPSSERSLSEVPEGDLVKVSLDGDDGFRQHWMLYCGFENGADFFMKQDTSRGKGEAHLVAIYSSSRRTHQYDRRIGVILDSIHYFLEFHGPKREDYLGRVNKLKQAGEWRD